MSKKTLLKYVFMYLLFILGVLFYSNGIITLFSSILLFGGGYISLKNTVDYRLIKRNFNKHSEFSNDIINENKVVHNKNIRLNNPENIIGVKRTRRYSRVRRKY